jgi:transmembrane sensor
MPESDQRRQDREIRAAAARWTVLRDRGLSSREAVEFELWLAADPRHARALERSAGTWTRLDRLPDEVATRALADGHRFRWRQRLAAGLAIGAVAAGFLWLLLGSWSRPGPAPESSALQAAGPRLLALADGTEVKLNAGGEIREEFTPGERRVSLVRGEAHFAVTKDAARPFIVLAGDLRIRAVGTAFNVNLEARSVEVLVTEGLVGVGRTPGPPSSSSSGPEIAEPLVQLSAGERARVTGAARGEGGAGPAVVVTRVGAAEISRSLAWQDQLLRLGGATLGEITAEFERRTGHRVVIADRELAKLRLGGRIRADDLEGFARLLPTMVDVVVEAGPGDVLVLRRKKTETP